MMKQASGAGRAQNHLGYPFPFHNRSALEAGSRSFVYISLCALPGIMYRGGDGASVAYRLHQAAFSMSFLVYMGLGEEAWLL